MWIMMKRRTMCRTKHHWRSSSSLCFRSVGANDNLKVRLCSNYPILQLGSGCVDLFILLILDRYPRGTKIGRLYHAQGGTDANPVRSLFHFPLTDASLFTYRTYVHGCPPFLAPATCIATQARLRERGSQQMIYVSYNTRAR